ncbi:MAG: thioredoxin domain-containing protein [Xanthomonadales bacterium]|nr:thioredoxin domain-containing protein [Xanthomonadales bacterium]
MLIRSFVIGCFALASTATGFANGVAGNWSHIALQDLNGKPALFGEILSGKPVYLKFWATWCQTCLQQMPHFQGATEKYKNELDIFLINIDINEDVHRIEQVKQRFNLDAPIFLDVSGEFSRQVGLVGTPYHIVLDKQGNMLYRGHEANEALNSALAEAAAGRAGKSEDRASADEFDVRPTALSLENRDEAVFFLAPWCDWYLEETRPEVSKNCIAGQKLINELSAKYPALTWRGISTRLWVGEKELIDYEEKYKVPFGLEIDKSNELHVRYKIKYYPTLIVFKNGKEEFRSTLFEDGAKIDAMLQGLFSPT